MRLEKLKILKLREIKSYSIQQPTSKKKSLVVIPTAAIECLLLGVAN